VWQDGMSNDGLVISNWFGDQRVLGDGVGGRSAIARLNWDAWFGGQVQLRYRTLENQVYGVIPYQRYHEVSVGYSRPWKGIIIGGEFESGSDAFGRSFGRLAGFVRYDNPNAQPVAALLDSQGVAGDADTSGQLFVDAGVNALRVRTDLTELTPKTTGRSMTRRALGPGGTSRGFGSQRSGRAAGSR